MASKGGDSKDTLFLIGIVVFLVLAWLSVGAKKSLFSNPFNLAVAPQSGYSNSSNGYSNGTAGTSGSGSTAANTNLSPYAGEVYIQSGNAGGAYQPYEEYIVLSASGNVTTPIDITGWSLTNARGTRVYQVGSTVERFASNKVLIPKAVSIFNPDLSGAAVPIMLGPNQNAMIITGSISKNGTKIPSFRDNECLGYLSQDKQSGITIQPSPQYSCPVPYQESGVNVLDRSCTDFINSMSYCHTPNFNNSVYVTNGPVAGYVDSVGGLSNSCKAFLQTHFSYSGCVANHIGDKNFLTNTWHVYLNNPTELWADRNETITLFDQNGKVVTTYSY